MARRRRDPTVDPVDELEALGLPEVLRRCFAEDWVGVGEPAPPWMDGAQWELIVAWGRWRDARRAWCA
jgi:hypothetical protein